MDADSINIAEPDHLYCPGQTIYVGSIDALVPPVQAEATGDRSCLWFSSMTRFIWFYLIFIDTVVVAKVKYGPTNTKIRMHVARKKQN